MLANAFDILIAFAGNVLALLTALDNPTFTEVGRGLSIVSFVIRTLSLF